MKKIIVTTRQTILQDWEYEIEVPDDLLGKYSRDQWRGVSGHLLIADEVRDAIFEKIYNGDIEGRCLDSRMNRALVDNPVLAIEGEKILNIVDIDDDRQHAESKSNKEWREHIRGDWQN